MVLKRQLGERGEKESEIPIGGYKRRQLIAALKGAGSARALPDYAPILEPLVRKWVREEVERAISQSPRSSSNQIEYSGTRTLQLRFHDNLQRTLFTGSRVLSEDQNPIKIVLYDCNTKSIVKSGPSSSIKVNIVVLDGDFGPDDCEDWSKKEFDRKIVQNREGKRPLVTGELIVPLQNGVGYIGDVSFTDNSSWIRSGKFRLGAMVNTNSDEVRIREGMTNAFKVKDHRGELYQKHYPPSLDDEVWRLEKIGKEGAFHKKLANIGVFSVGDFLRLYIKDKFSLRNELCNISNKIWETIVAHATSCTLDGKKFLYKTEQGIGLIFNSIHKVIGLFDEQNCYPLESQNLYQMGLVENLKQHAFKNLKDWVDVTDPSIAGYPMLLASQGAVNLNNPNFGLEETKFQDHYEIQMNTTPPHDYEVEQANDLFVNPSGENSHPMQVFNPILRNSFGMVDSPVGGLYPWSSSQLSTDDLPIDNNFQVESSSCQGNGTFLGSTSHGMISSNSGIFIPRNGRPKTKWCKVLAVVKWRILARRNVAAKKLKHGYYYI